MLHKQILPTFIPIALACIVPMAALAQADGVLPMPVAGTVHVNNLANVEAVLDIVANGVETSLVSSAGPTFMIGIVLLFVRDRRKLGVFFMVWAVSGLVCGLALPGVFNSIVSSTRDASLFR